MVQGVPQCLGPIFIFVIIMTEEMLKTAFKKYDLANGMPMSGLRVNSEFAGEAQALVNAGQSYNSWKAVRAVHGVIKRWALQFRTNFDLPWSVEQTNNFVCIGKRMNLAPSTVKTYLSRIRKLHVVKCGVTLETDQSTLEMLRGWERVQEEPARKRIAVTPYILLKLKVGVKPDEFIDNDNDYDEVLFNECHCVENDLNYMKSI